MPCVRSYGERSQTLQDPRTRDLTGPLIGLILVARGVARGVAVRASAESRPSHVSEPLREVQRGPHAALAEFTCIM